MDRTARSLMEQFFRAKVSGTPFELSTHFNLVINLKTAKILGIMIPPLVMVQAAKVIL